MVTQGERPRNVVQSGGEPAVAQEVATTASPARLPRTITKVYHYHNKAGELVARREEKIIVGSRKRASS